MSVRKCEIVQQTKYLPGYPDHWRETLEANLEAESNIKSWAYILHDKDATEDGTTKEPHIHIVIELAESRHTVPWADMSACQHNMFALSAKKSRLESA